MAPNSQKIPIMLSIFPALENSLKVLMDKNKFNIISLMHSLMPLSYKIYNNSKLTVLNKKYKVKWKVGVTTEYLATIILDITAHLFLKNDMHTNKLPTVAGCSEVMLKNKTNRLFLNSGTWETVDCKSVKNLTEMFLYGHTPHTLSLHWIKTNDAYKILIIIPFEFENSNQILQENSLDSKINK